jgi:hypothetical protein
MTFAVFISDQYEAQGGALDYYGTIDAITEEQVLAIIYRFVMDRIQAYGYHTKEAVVMNYCYTGRMSLLNLETKELRCSTLAVRDGGRTLYLGGISEMDWFENEPPEILPIEITYQPEKQ